MKLEVHFKTTHGSHIIRDVITMTLKVLLTLNIKQLIGETLWLGFIETKGLTLINIFPALPHLEFEQYCKR